MLRLHASLVLRERQLSISDTLYDENETLLAVLQLVVCNEGMTSQSCHFQECETHECLSETLHQKMKLCQKQAADDCTFNVIKLIILSAVGGSAVGLFALFLFFVYRRRVAKKDEIPINHWVISIKETNGNKLSMCENWVTKMRLHELRKATNDFSNDNIIDSGTRGNIYKATLSNGSLVAVKRLWNTQQSKTDFLTELTTLGKVKHPNLVFLKGFCIARNEKLLIYEYMPKRTLYQQLHQIKANTKIKEWLLRLKIALGVARGLAWLHHNYNFSVVHRNISSKCVLLDQDDEARISGFGYAQLMNPLNANLTTFVNGQYGNVGYVAPEYTCIPVASLEGDVYSFGVLLLELITGKVPTQEANPPYGFKQNLVDWIARLSGSSLLNAVDKSLSWISCDEELRVCLGIANACVAAVPEQRPTMLHYKILHQKMLITTWNAWLAFAVGLSVGGLLYLLFFYCRIVDKKKDGIDVKEDVQPNHWIISVKETNEIKLSKCKMWVKKMRLHELRKATNDFSNDNIIDSGIGGNMYKGKLSNGSFVAVKRLWNTQHSKTEFFSELTTLGRAKHPNLVSLLGFCIARKEKLLVYRYMPKRTLYQLLHQPQANAIFKEWPLRLKIALGVARGLAWLHHNFNFCIVHRKISSKCILLDQDNDPKISDFGSAQLMKSIHSHLTTFVNGQFGNMGYVAPEYTRMLVASTKGDVYSFGILLLEIITGKVPTQEPNPPHNFKQNLVEWIDRLSDRSLLLNAVDKSLTSASHGDDLLECLQIASACVASTPKQRPTMLHSRKS
ncbi:hypothetical protein AAC387_Pa12g1430 [Persea americana]